MNKYRHLTPLAWTLAIMLGLYTLAWAADSKISALTELAAGSIDDTDQFVLADVSGVSETKKYTWLSLKTDLTTYFALAATYQPLDSTLTDIADGTIAENLVNTANPWAINEGGTGAATALAARVALLPSMTGKANMFARVNSGETDVEYTDTISVSEINLPSGVTSPSTTAGQIKHDTDEGNASAGGSVVWYDGTNVRTVVDGAASGSADYTVLIKSEFIPVAYMTDGSSPPASTATYGTTRYRDFDSGSSETVKFIWNVPMDLIGTTVKVRAFAMVSNGTAPADTEGVSWGISAADVEGSESVDATRGTKVQSEDTDLDDDCNAQYDLCIFPYVEVTPAVTVTAGHLMAFTVERTVDDSDDDYAQDIGLIGVEIKYKARLNLVDTW